VKRRDPNNLVKPAALRVGRMRRYQPIPTNEIDGLCGGRRRLSGKGGIMLTMVDGEPIELSRETRAAPIVRNDPTAAKIIPSRAASSSNGEIGTPDGC
jgi:hypothetical protein